ncbi:ubiquitin-conjugating enzyme E2 D4-like [Amphiura filiformis]|uniref:ubiquitin-conjugating enzyme E2 D4-like n=1 Tax=Amphiura filiformis TaxID=82378 RepID=UPI003B222092
MADIQVEVTNCGGRDPPPLSMRSNQNVGHLKQKIRKATDVDLNEVYITFQGEKLLDDSATLDSVGLEDGSVFTIGKAGTPYAGGLFYLDITLPENYPNSPPKVVLLVLLDMSAVFDHKILIDHLVLESVLFVLDAPNPDSATSMDMRDEYVYSRQDYNRKARECTQTYA